MSEVVENKPENKPVNNEIRVGNRTKPKDLIAQCEKLLKEDKLKEIHLSAVGNSIGDLIIAVEILKSSNPGLFQKNILSTIGPRAPKNNTTKEKENEKPQKLYPHLEVVLSCEKFESCEAAKISEEERKILIETLDKQKIAFKKQRKFRSFRRNYGFRYRRQRFASRINANRFNRNIRNNGRNRSYNNSNLRRPRPGFNKRNNRRMFVKSPAGRRFNNPTKAINPASRGQSVNKELAKN
jgi:hypothetical protein